MALTNKQIVALMKAAIEVTPGGTYSYNGENLTCEAINETLREELKNLGGNYDAYRFHKEELFKLVEEAVSDILPKRIENAYGRFAETRTFPQSTTAVFTRKVGRVRAKQFVTHVGLAGVYEVFKLGETKYEIKTSAIGGAYQIGFEEFLDGRVDFAEVARLVTEAMDELIYREIAKALMDSVTQLPAANQVAVNGFDEAGMERLITVASAYGTPTIYCTREFAVKMVPANEWRSDNMRDQKWENGYLPTFHGVPIVILDQSFEDETNARKIIDPGYAWVIPSGGDDRPVKVAFEGSLHMRERENEDWSRDVQMYQKVGVGVIMTNNLCSYVDLQLKGKMNTIPG